MKRGLYILHLTAKDVGELVDALTQKDPNTCTELTESVRAKVKALQDIVTATKNIHEASEHYKSVTGYYDNQPAASIKSDV